MPVDIGVAMPDDILESIKPAINEFIKIVRKSEDDWLAQKRTKVLEITGAICADGDQFKLQSVCEGGEDRCSLQFCPIGQTINVHNHPSGIGGTSIMDDFLSLDTKLIATCIVAPEYTTEARKGNIPVTRLFKVDCTLYNPGSMNDKVKNEIGDAFMTARTSRGTPLEKEEPIKRILRKNGAIQEIHLLDTELEKMELSHDAALDIVTRFLED